MCIFASPASSVNLTKSCGINPFETAQPSFSAPVILSRHTLHSFQFKSLLPLYIATFTQIIKGRGGQQSNFKHSASLCPGVVFLPCRLSFWGARMYRTFPGTSPYICTLHCLIEFHNNKRIPMKGHLPCVLSVAILRHARLKLPLWPKNRSWG